MSAGRNHPRVEVRNNVACQSSRNGAGISLIVLHDTEGANIPHSVRDLVGLGEFFDRLSTQASSNVAVDEDGQSGRYVPDDRKAWAQAFYNSVALSIEQIGFARQSWTSKSKDRQLHETARWIAHWSYHHKVPIRRGSVSRDGRVTRSGVVQHRDLGNLGGGHVDVSASYPMNKVLSLARGYLRELKKDYNRP